MHSIINSLSPEQLQFILAAYNTIEAWVLSTAQVVNNSVINEDIII